jgi:glycosyltransferase involved in cell wall biosynthesis
MISVIIPLYNKEKSIAETIKTVLHQTYRDFELIVINDGSTDQSRQVIEEFEDDRIRIIDKPNGGVSSARNLGILNARYEWLALLDADDIWHPEHLQLLLSAISCFENDDIGGVANNYYSSHSKIFDHPKFSVKTPFLVSTFFDFMSQPVSKFNSSSIMVKKSKIIKTGLFNEQTIIGEDIECWYKLFSSYKLIYNPTITSVYFIGAENRSVHRIVPLNQRFHSFDFKKKSKSEIKFLDKLIALIMIDYFEQRAWREVFSISKLYYFRGFGVLVYFLKLIGKKLGIRQREYNA